MKFFYLVFCVLIVFYLPGFTQKVSVSSINEQRSTGEGYGNRCDIELKVTGDEVRKFKSLRLSKLSKVIDDQDLDLLMDEEKNDYEYKKIEEEGRVQFEVKIPARKATVIREISGELSLYGPTEANGGIVQISNYQAKANTNLLPEGLGFKLISLNQASIDKYTKEQSEKQKVELNKLPAGAKEIAILLSNTLDGFSGFGDEDNKVMFVMDGDDSKLVSLHFEDATGKEIDRNGYSKIGNLIAYYYNETPKANWKLVLNIETQGSIKTVPFKLMNIDLP